MIDTAGYDLRAYQHDVNKVALPVRIGDLVIKYSRLLHAAHGNKSDCRHTVITMWYILMYHQLSGRIRTYLERHPRPEAS